VIIWVHDLKKRDVYNKLRSIWRRRAIEQGRMRVRELQMEDLGGGRSTVMEMKVYSLNIVPPALVVDVPLL
jgi:hypothetical protein